MISYKQLLKGAGKARKNIWYMCGPNDALVADTVSVAKEYIYGGVTNVCLGVFFGESSICDIEEFILRPYFEERKVVIVYNPSDIEGIHTILSTKDTSTFFILIDYGVTEPNDALNTFLVGNSKVKSVKCLLRSEEDLKLLINSRLNIDKDAVDLILNKANGDSEWVLNKVLIMERLDVDRVTRKLVSTVCTDRGIPSFEKSLIQFDKRACFLYTNSIGVDNINLRSIIEDVHNLALLNTSIADYGKQVRPISDKTGLTKKQIDEYIRYASYYDGPSAKRSLTLLMKLYKSLIRGDKLAFLALVSGW